MGKITLTYEKKNYVLTYTRNTVRQMEAQGFNIEGIGTAPATMIPLLFQGAFLAENKGIKRKLMDDMFDNIEDKSGLIAALAELYVDTVNTLVGESEAKEGNSATWKVTE